jgi:hypothetical protein
VNPETPSYEYDLNRIIVRPLYFGLIVNITIPMALLFVCYWVNNKYGVPDKLGSGAEPLMYVLAAVALAEAVFAVWWRGKLFGQPMIRRKETFEEDFAAEYYLRCRPLFSLIASISIYGFVFYYLTGRFNASAMFVIFSFLVFQLVRPRFGLVKKLLDRQREMMERGRFKT